MGLEESQDWSAWDGKWASDASYGGYKNQDGFCHYAIDVNMTTNPWTGAQVEAIRALTAESVAETRRALDAATALGLGETRVAATMLKDLGKVHGFVASLFGGPDAALGRECLAEARGAWGPRKR